MKKRLEEELILPGAGIAGATLEAGAKKNSSNSQEELFNMFFEGVLFEAII